MAIKNNWLVILDEFGAGMQARTPHLLLDFFLKMSRHSQLMFMTLAVTLTDQNVKSNSGNTVYLSGRLIGKDIVEVTTIGIYRNHNCVGQIDLKFDTEGNFIPYSKENKDSSHFHLFFTDSKTGETRRKSHDKTNTFPIDSRYSDLIQKIVNYNKQHKL